MSARTRRIARALLAASVAVLALHACRPEGYLGHWRGVEQESSPYADAGPEANSPAAQDASQSPELHPLQIDQTDQNNPAGLSATEVEQLMRGGSGAGLRWLYPYDGTVFPRGTLAPVIMWDGDPAADALYLHIRSRAFDYKGILRPVLAGATQLPFGLSQTVGSVVAAVSGQQTPQLPLAQELWDTLGRQAQGKFDPITIELSVRANGNVAGPIVSHIVVAQAAIKGSIYYNSNNSGIAPADTTGELVMRVPPGGSAQYVAAGTCHGCHSVSADGSRLLVQWADPSLSVSAQQSQGFSYQLGPDGPIEASKNAVGRNTGFAALYPDGSKYLSTSLALDVGLSLIFQGLELSGAPVDARLYDSITGQSIPDTGIPTGALMPAFSPDGTLLAFNDALFDGAHGIQLMDYDTTHHKASHTRLLTRTDSSDRLRPAWPAFLPDEQALVFTRIDDAQFSGFVAAGEAAVAVAQAGALLNMPTSTMPASSDVYMVSVTDDANNTPTLLAQAMGFNTTADANNGMSYLPFGADDVHHNFFPTVMPVAAGGYFWLFFDSLRHYGSLGLQRAVWGAAIDIPASGSYQNDLSHPAFYLPGQELGSDNRRAIAALTPCKQETQACSSGIDCCSGSCALANNAAVGSCSRARVGSCASREQHCATASDCCQHDDRCIAGFCTLVLP